MCSRQHANFAWVFPVRPNYAGAQAEIEDALEGVEVERKKALANGFASDEVMEYLEELHRFAVTFMDPSGREDLAELQHRYSSMMNGISRVHRRARAARLPSACSFGFTTAEVQDFRFKGEAAAACRVARDDILAAPDRAAAGGGSQVERFIELQRDFGRIYVDLAKQLAKAAPSTIPDEAKQLIEAYLRAGQARVANEAALQAGDDAQAAAAAKEFEKHNAQANRLARSLELPFCVPLLS